MFKFLENLRFKRDLKKEIGKEKYNIIMSEKDAKRNIIYYLVSIISKNKDIVDSISEEFMIKYNKYFLDGILFYDLSDNKSEPFSTYFIN